MPELPKSYKILFCPSHYQYTSRSGSEFYSSYNLANRISTKFPKSVVIAGKSDIKKNIYRIIEIQKKQPENWMFDLSQWTTLNSIIFALSYHLEGYRISRKESFDLIHHIRPFAFGATFNLLPFLPHLRNTPFVIGEFCSPYSEKASMGEHKLSLYEKIINLFMLIIKPVLKLLSDLTLKRADAILVTDEETKNLLVKTVCADKVHIIPHAKDKLEYAYNPIKFDNERIIILVASRLIPRKRVDLAIKAFKEASKKSPKLLLQIAGDGPLMNSLQQLVKELNIYDKVEFLGNVEYIMMPNIFSKAHIFLHTAEEEVFGQVYIEALASGVPILTTETNGAKSIVTEKIGIISTDAEITLADNLLGLVGDTEKMIEMSLSARQHFEHKYDYDTVIIPKIISIYQEVLKKYDTFK